MTTTPNEDVAVVLVGLIGLGLGFTEACCLGGELVVHEPDVISLFLALTAAGGVF